MKIEPSKSEVLTFKDYYQSLEDLQKTKLRDEILKECGISYPSFYSKLNKKNYTNLEKKEIERICDLRFLW